MNAGASSETPRRMPLRDREVPGSGGHVHVAEDWSDYVGVLLSALKEHVETARPIYESVRDIGTA